MRGGRVPFRAPHCFGFVTRTALWHARENPDNVHGALLTLLEDCTHSCDLSGLEQVGARYRQLRRIGWAVGMSAEQLAEWIALAESIPLSERHALHVLEQLAQQRGKAA